MLLDPETQENILGAYNNTQKEFSSRESAMGTFRKFIDMLEEKLSVVKALGGCGNNYETMQGFLEQNFNTEDKNICIYSWDDFYSAEKGGIIRVFLRGRIVDIVFEIKYKLSETEKYKRLCKDILKEKIKKEKIIINPPDIRAAIGRYIKEYKQYDFTDEFWTRIYLEIIFELATEAALAEKDPDIYRGFLIEKLHTCY